MQRGLEHDDEDDDDDDDDDDADDADAHGVEVAKYQSYQYRSFWKTSLDSSTGSPWCPVWSTSQLLHDQSYMVNPRLKILHVRIQGRKFPHFFGWYKNSWQISPNKQTTASESRIFTQELVHWAGTVCVGRGELEITFEELLDAMHASRQWFIPWGCDDIGGVFYSLGMRCNCAFFLKMGPYGGTPIFMILFHPM